MVGLARRRMDGERWWAWPSASDNEMSGDAMSDAGTEVMLTYDEMSVISRLQWARVDRLLRAIWSWWRSR